MDTPFAKRVQAKKDLESGKHNELRLRVALKAWETAMLGGQGSNQAAEIAWEHADDFVAEMLRDRSK